jgi:hypothetical protein
MFGLLNPFMQLPPVTGGGGGSDDTDAAAYFAALTTAPSSAERARVNALVTALKGAGLWALLDWLVLMAAETAQAGRVNLRKPSKLLTATNSPSFIANVGWAGDASSSYMDFGEAFQATGNLFAQNSHCIGGLVTQQSSYSGIRFIYGNVANNPRNTMSVSNTSATGGYRAADSTDNIVTATNTRNGHWTGVRPSSAVKRSYYNGALLAEVSLASTGLNTSNAATHNSRGPTGDDYMGLVYSGASLTESQVGQLHAILRDNYFKAKGFMQ